MKHYLDDPMDDETWDAHITKVREQVLALDSGRFDWEVNPIPKEILHMIESMVETGEKKPVNRRSIVNALKSMLKPYGNYPWKRGKEEWSK